MVENKRDNNNIILILIIIVNICLNMCVIGPTLYKNTHFLLFRVYTTNSAFIFDKNNTNRPSSIVGLHVTINFYGAIVWFLFVPGVNGVETGSTVSRHV